MTVARRKLRNGTRAIEFSSKEGTVMPRTMVGRVAALCAAVAVAACGGDSTSPNGNGNGNGNQGSITLTLSLSALSVAQGGNIAVTATIGRAGGFTGTVAIAAEGVPANVTATPSPASIGASATQSTITFAATAGATPGNATITIRASGAGVADQTRTLTLTITAAAQPGFTMTVAPGTLTIPQGGQLTSTATLARTGGFAGNVQFTHTGAPAGVNVSFNPTATTANTSTITVTVSGAVAANTYPVTIRANAAGLPERTATLNVMVTAPAGGGNRNFRFCPPTPQPIFAAYQDGNGPWTPVAVVNNTVTFPIASARAGLLYVFNPAPNVYVTNYYYAATTEMGTSLQVPCPVLPATKIVNGSVANVGANETAYVGLATAGVPVNPPNLTFSLQNVAEGVTDLVATRVAVVVALPNVTQTANRAIIRRGLNPPANSNLPVLDFGAAESFAPVTRNLTLNNLGADASTVQLSYLAAGGGAAALYSELFGVASANRQIPTLPNAQAGDLHGLSIIAATGLPPYATSRGLLAYFTASADKTFTLGAPVGAVTVTAAATAPYARLRVQYALQSDYDDGITVNYNQASAAGARAVIIGATGSYLAASPNFDHTEPDLSGLAGWNVVWGLVSGTLTQWTLVGVGAVFPGLLDGGISLQGTRSGSITP
jgi:hypothetical protein